MSLFGLWARRCRKNVALILAAMAAIELGLFLWTAHRSLEGGLTQIMTDSHLNLPAVAAFIALTAALSGVGLDYGAKTSYTLRRLSLTPRRSMLLRAAHNTLCYFIFWGVQFAVALGLCLLWRQLYPQLWGGQSALLAFYRVPYLHALLPLGDWPLYLRNVMWFVMMGCITVLNDKKQTFFVVYYLMFGIYFHGRMGFDAGVTAELLVVLFLLFLAVSDIVRAEDEPGEEAENDGAQV